MILVNLVMLLMFQTPAPHSATLTWVDDKNPTGTTYSVYRANGLCSGTPSWSKMGTGIALKTYVDTPLQPGNYCYQVTASFSGVESAPSPTAPAAVPTWNPEKVVVIVQ